MLLGCDSDEGDDLDQRGRRGHHGSGNDLDQMGRQLGYRLNEQKCEKSYFERQFTDSKKIRRRSRSKVAVAVTGSVSYLVIEVIEVIDFIVPGVVAENHGVGHGSQHLQDG